MRRFPLVLVLLLAACGSDPEAVESTGEGLPVQQTSSVELRAATSEDVLTYVRESPASVKIVNFWATWCLPCREEFPDLIRVADEYRDRGVEVVFVSADFPEQEPEAIRFLNEQGAAGVSFLKNEGDDAFISAFDEDWMGELPATILYGPDDEKVAVWHGITTYEALTAVADSVLNLQ